MADKYCYNEFLMEFFLGEEKMKIREKKEWSNLILFQNCPIWTYIEEKISTFTFGAWSFLLVHIWFTPSEGHKGFVN